MDFYIPVKWSGSIRVTPLICLDNLWIPAGDGEVFPNLITDGGYDQFAAAVANSNIDTQITYIALGNDNTAVASTNTTLNAEQFRKPIASYTTGITTGQVVTTAYIAPSEATTFTIEEIGWFGDGATATADSGLLIAHVLYNRAKTSGEALQIDRTDTFS